MIEVLMWVALNLRDGLVDNLKRRIRQGRLGLQRTEHVSDDFRVPWYLQASIQKCQVITVYFLLRTNPWMSCTVLRATQEAGNGSAETCDFKFLRKGLRS